MGIKLNLGCGNTIKEGWVNIDNRPLPGVNIVRDLMHGLPYSDETVEEIYSENFLEHIPSGECVWFMNEMHRVLIPGGKMTHLVPMAGSENFYQDFDHKSAWVSNTFTYFQKGHHRNEYYGGTHKPWILDSYEVNCNKVQFVTMTKAQ